MPFPSPVKLTKSEQQYFLNQLGGGGCKLHRTQIHRHSREKTSYRIDRREVKLRDNVLQGIRFALKATLHLPPCFRMVMIDYCFGYILNPRRACCERPLSEIHVFQARQVLGKPQFLPKTFCHGRVGIVAKERKFFERTGFRKIFGEDLVLTKLGSLSANLPAVSNVDIAIFDRCNERFEPLHSLWNAVATNKRQNVSACAATS